MYVDPRLKLLRLESEDRLCSWVISYRKLHVVFSDTLSIAEEPVSLVQWVSEKWDCFGIVV